MHPVQKFNFHLQVLKLFFQADTSRGSCVHILDAKEDTNMRMGQRVSTPYFVAGQSVRALTGRKASISNSAFFRASAASSYLTLSIASWDAMALFAVWARSYRASQGRRIKMYYIQGWGSQGILSPTEGCLSPPPDAPSPVPNLFKTYHWLIIWLAPLYKLWCPPLKRILEFPRLQTKM